MLMVEENHVSGSRTTQSDNQMLYTEADSPVIMENVVDRHTMVGADKNRTRGIINMLTIFPNPP